ncbi:MAG: Rossmann-like domain-containing protein [Candidatus Bathyarchaeia archaeon]
MIDVLQVNSDDIVVMVGLIKPFRKVFESKAKGLYILERGMRRNINVYPDTGSEDIIPKSDIVVITGSSMANGTIDRLLDLSENAKTKAMVGPTASCIPDPLVDKGVDYVGGIRLVNSDLTWRIIMEEGGTRQLRRSGKFIKYKRA